MGDEFIDWNAKYKLPEDQRLGLTTERANQLHEQYGYNELEQVEVSKFQLLLSQFMGTMPYMLEIALIISAATQDYADVGIIAAMLCCNGFLGYKEELDCLKSLEELTKKMESKVTVQRDNVGCSLNTRELVPGDVILCLGGLQVPADIDWIEGDVLSVDTAALTGEPIPRKYPSTNYGQRIECGCTIASGEAYGIVRNIGADTEVGKANAAIAGDKAQGKILSVFEAKTMKAVQVIIVGAIVVGIAVFITQGIKENEFTGKAYKKDLLTVLSIIIASIPIALPIVLNVTMSLGSGKMATEYNAAVTSIPALQDIASMSVLCSDKTGTLTTAKMTINHDMVWCDEKFTKKDVGMYAMLASSRDKKEDAVDRTVVKYFDKIFGPAGQLKTAEFTKTGGMGFNPIYKRVVVVQSHPTKGTIKIAKGLATKVLDTKQGTPDDAEEQWTCADIDRLRPIVAAKDKELSTAGYKTLGVAVKINESPWVFVGILPMMDPPRHDTPATIANLKNAGIRVKMITGDHLNIGIETARQIGMGMNIYPGEMVRDNSNAAKQRVEDGDGFAQVLPSDKREVVEILKRDFGYVVGMTGDGVNDAPALSAAQCGVAVDDATDAAKNAAKILLTSPGLGAVYSAVVESRRIFRKLKAYITYRFAASIQIVSVLSIIIFASNCPVNPTYVILLALFNDLTMLPIAYDYQMASSLPEVPNVNYILLMSTVLGLCETAFSLMFAYGAGPSKLMKSPMSMKQCPYPQINPDKAPQNAKSIQAAIWLQMFIASEILIFSARAPSYFMLYMWPSIALTCSVLGGCLIASLMAWQAAYFGKLYIQDIVHTWVYCILCLFIIDCIKVKVLQWLDENLEVLPDEEIKAPPEEEAMDEDDAELEAMNKMLPPEEQLTTRQSAAANRMTDRAVAADERLSQLDPAAARMSLMQGRGSMAPRPSQASSILAGGEPGADRVSVAGRGVVRASGAGNMGDSGLRGSFVNTSGSLRPNVPGTLKVKR